MAGGTVTVLRSEAHRTIRMTLNAHAKVTSGSRDSFIVHKETIGAVTNDEGIGTVGHTICWMKEDRSWCASQALGVLGSEAFSAERIACLTDIAC